MLNLSKNKLPELDALKELISSASNLLSSNVLGEVSTDNASYPIISVEIGPKDTTLPVLALFAGVHGLERIGSHVVISYLNKIITQLKWDKNYQKYFKDFRIVMIPIINPIGMANKKRSNGQGVDLMRNAPVDSLEFTLPLVAGHRISHHLPWYRGHKLEEESKILIEYVFENCSKAKSSIALDVHSGFGLKDHIWYPYGYSKKEFPKEREILTIKNILDETHPYHIYQIAPQSHFYKINGDLWDYIFDHDSMQDSCFLPLTLELGSWLWVKKNPVQILSRLGTFNPLKMHRYHRIMRRHIHLLDFLSQIVRNPSVWKNL